MSSSVWATSVIVKGIGYYYYQDIIPVPHPPPLLFPLTISSCHQLTLLHIQCSMKTKAFYSTVQRLMKYFYWRKLSLLLILLISIHQLLSTFFKPRVRRAIFLLKLCMKFHQSEFCFFSFPVPNSETWPGLRLGRRKTTREPSLIALFLTLRKGQMIQDPLIWTPGIILDGFLDPGIALDIIHLLYAMFSLEHNWGKRMGGEGGVGRKERQEQKEYSENSVEKVASVHIFQVTWWTWLPIFRIIWNQNCWNRLIWSPFNC